MFPIGATLATRPSQPRPMSSHMAPDMTAAIDTVVAIRSAPVRLIGDPAATYQADRHRNPYAIDSGTAVANATRHGTTRCRASSAASSTPGGTHITMYAARRP